MPNAKSPTPNALPTHVAIIMDGNGRWAKRKGLGRLLGHREGYIALKKILQEASDIGLNYLTVYAFSAENWRRPKDEVSGLMRLIEQAAREQLRAMHENNVRVRVAGRIHEVPPSLQDVLNEGIALTKNNTGVTFTLAINYGGRAEIVDAMKSILNAGVPCDEITEETLARHLYNPDHPAVDLMIRTAGEMRWSNFLLWQSAYAEMVVTEKPWPEFDPAEFQVCLAHYSERTRKFGAVVDQP
ncbi:di-trans,poly-cis-decaprenylcistransferase [bacterium]|nr:MAG: di-trans,poly-cis-decaprenylcistransferase [bacterium]